jgi:hypothetical protein
MLMSLNREAAMGRFYQWYQQAPFKAREEGLTWYETAECIIDRLATMYDYDRWTVAGVVAALSQRMRWKENLFQAERCLQGKRPRGIELACQKAMRIRNGEAPEDVLGGPKIRAFYRAILGDPNAVVIDTWMLLAAGWHRAGYTIKQYNRLAAELRADAFKAGQHPAVFQAIVWCAIRNGEE